jgi:hypothetical protein
MGVSFRLVTASVSTHVSRLPLIHSLRSSKAKKSVSFCIAATVLCPFVDLISKIYYIADQGCCLSWRQELGLIFKYRPYQVVQKMIFKWSEMNGSTDLNGTHEIGVPKYVYKKKIPLWILKIGRTILFIIPWTWSIPLPSTSIKTGTCLFDRSMADRLIFYDTRSHT